MRPLIVAPLLFAVAACASVPEAQTGSVHQYNGDTVTIRGQFAANGQPAKPTQAMIAQAKEVCPGATYLSATPDPNSVYMFLYLFRC